MTRDTVPVRPETRYARSGAVSIAYQVVGDGPFDLVLVPGFGLQRRVRVGGACAKSSSSSEQLSSFCRLIVFDKRGTGLSDRVAEIA